MSRTASRTSILAELSITVALSFVLNQIKIYRMPYGGSVTLGSMVPIPLLSLRRGLRVGASAGVILGLVKMFWDGYFYNPFGMLLDYPLAFGALGLAALFRRQPVVGVVVALAGRFLSHFVSGVLFFWMYAPKDISPVVYSAIYNGGYILPEMLISGIITFFLARRKLLTLTP